MNRRLLTGLLALLLNITARAQIGTGAIYLGGNISGGTLRQHTNNTTPESKGNFLYINPSIGKALRNNFIAGLDLLYQHNHYDNYYYGTQESKQNGYGGGIFLRKYVPIAGRLSFFAESKLNYNYQKLQSIPASQPGGSYSNRQESVSASLYPGLSIAVFRSFYLEAGFNDLVDIAYTASTTVDNNSVNVVITKGKSFGIQGYLTSLSYLNIGARFIIPQKRAGQRADPGASSR